ncbi:class I SAM-dependent methyltransferase [Pseudomonas auratipiscis]|uniref:Class I SAM-dependent methyltransferase n=1 Tax=Pseudomonas auratipiscis TaxID=3115853 RepID=A0AB35WMP7_9PSED|nr:MULTISPECIES: class I SAM-dependent methyltransferase [unclassified Pseudomonas]MEE1865128.1 class I SAM-dependent methyltransferase [Pseudomonas sp. 120P]MEE1955931.1 class I SAM-dependent methyltransferase [Pseudomonas sp. 119P]
MATPYLSKDVYQHNQNVWNRLAREGCDWSKPVSSEVIQAARRGEWQIQLIPAELPAGWLDDVQGKRILCLAGSGGQQAPVLAAAGADVVVVDASQDQLALDEMVAKRDNLSLRTVLGDMQDLSAFNDESFDLIFHPISNLYVPNIQKVWAECYRVLCKGGKLLSSFYNPAVFVFERSADLAKEGLMKPRFTLPYADITDLSEGEIADKIARNEAFVFGHTLAEQINGQLQAGLLLTGFEEAFQPTPRFLIDNYMPTFIATCSVKPR